jgi:hypothetical protein
MRRNRVSRTKEFGHTGIALDSSRRDPDQDDPETGLQEALVTGVSGLQEIRRSLLTGALDLHAMETEIPAVLSTEMLALPAKEIDAQPNLSIGALDLYAMETGAPANLTTEMLAQHAMATGTPLTKAPSDPSEASALSTTMCQ